MKILGLTANINFNKAESENKLGKDKFDMNMYALGAKAGYNIDLGNEWILEPNLTMMYGNINTQGYTTSRGAKINSQNTNNVLIQPQIKAKLALTNGWTPYALVGYILNSGNKTKLVANNIGFDDMQIAGYTEYGVGLNKIFEDSAWSCFLQATGKSGDRKGVEGNIGVKYSFLTKKKKKIVNKEKVDQLLMLIEKIKIIEEKLKLSEQNKAETEKAKTETEKTKMIENKAKVSEINETKTDKTKIETEKIKQKQGINKIQIEKMKQKQKKIRQEEMKQKENKIKQNQEEMKQKENKIKQNQEKMKQNQEKMEQKQKKIRQEEMKQKENKIKQNQEKMKQNQEKMKQKQTKIKQKTEKNKKGTGTNTTKKGKEKSKTKAKK